MKETLLEPFYFQFLSFYSIVLKAGREKENITNKAALWNVCNWISNDRPHAVAALHDRANKVVRLWVGIVLAANVCMAFTVWCALCISYIAHAVILVL